jgi:hypothetical protein
VSEIRLADHQSRVSPYGENSRANTGMSLKIARQSLTTLGLVSSACLQASRGSLRLPRSARAQPEEPFFPTT